MKSLKNKDMNKLSNDDLNSKLYELKMELMKTNAQVAMRTAPANPGMIKANKKMVARIITLLSQRTSTKEE
jgi:ribosomal protein L29